MTKRPSVKENPLGHAYWLVMIILPFLLYQTVLELDSSCEYYLSESMHTNASDVTYPRFSEGIARKHLREVTGYGPRTTGSEANEVRTPAYLLGVFRQLQALAQNRSAGHEVTFDHHIAHQGSFQMNFLHSSAITSVYRNVRNLVLRLHDKRDKPTSEAVGAVLINCHFDSVVDSPGASDDFISCALMLELVRVLLLRDAPLKHDLLFLFNGAEENLMQASHAFVTQHPWMPAVKTFVNLEGAGTAGRLFLFQSGPNAPWLVSEFAQSVMKPFASIIGQEIFQSGLIPSDTDFRIFRDYGHLPGVDFAFIKNGFLYHTKHDDEARIPPACLQLAGENILAFVERLARSDYVSSPSHYVDGEVIFYDLLGFFMIFYHARAALLLNVTVMLTSGLVLLYQCFTRGKAFCACVLKAFANHLLALLCQLSVGVALAMLMYSTNHCLTWYSNRYNLIAIYLVPMLWMFFTYHQVIAPKVFDWSIASTSTSSVSAARAHHISVQLFLLLGLLLCTVRNIHSAYLLVMWLLAGLLSNFLLHYCPRILQAEWRYLLWRVAVYTAPLLYHIYRSWGCHDVFIPILGRSGSTLNPELFMICLLFITTAIIPLHLAGDVYISKASHVRQLRNILLQLSVSFWICAVFTHVGFPYSSRDAVTPRQQRIVLIHTTREHYQVGGDLLLHHQPPVEQDSGLWVIALDVNGRQYLQQEIANLSTAAVMPCRVDRPFCGQPQLYPLIEVFSNGYYLPAAPHQAQPRPHLQLLSSQKLPQGLTNISIAVQGPAHNHIVVHTHAVRDGIRLVSWSLLPSTPPQPIETPSPAVGEHYFIYNGYGDAPQGPLVMWMLVQLDEWVSTAVTLQVALMSHYLAEPEKSTPKLREMLLQMPHWTVPASWTASYASYDIQVTR